MKSLLNKLLPLDKIFAFALKLGFLSEPLKLLAGWWNKAQGVKTQGLLVAAGALTIAASLGWVPWEQAAPFIKTLLAMSSATALEKGGRILDAIEKGSAAIAQEAAKQEPPKAE